MRWIGKRVIKLQKTSITIVIPIYEGAEFIDDLVEAIKIQSVKAEEIIFVVSKVGDTEKTERKLNNHQLKHLRYKLIDPSYPGKARNIGVEISKSEWIAFLDQSTLPSEEWLESLIKASDNGRYKFVGGLRTSVADTRYKKILKASTYGNASAKSLAGSLVSREIFISSKGFLPDVRAGEDWEWINRIPESEVIWLKKPLIIYSGLSSSFLEAVKKWFRYSFENSKIDIIYAQKFFYFLILIILILYFAYSWNFVFTYEQWDKSPYFIPHLNKIVWGVSLLLYLLYRGLIRPLAYKEKLNYLLPLNWILVGLNGLILDITKAPGRIVGFINYYLKKIT